MEIASAITQIPCILPIGLSQGTAKLYKDFAEQSSPHRYWAYPLNAAVSLAAFMATPFLTLIPLIANVVFAVIWAVSKEHAEAACAAIGKNFELIGKAYEGGVVLFIRIFSPAFMYDDVNNWK